VTVFGSVIGSVIAREKADIRKTASVEGSLSCGRLSVQEGATIKGKVETKNRPAAATKGEKAA
jgi:cytoskeletal protein CcmA (bactofilin family)